MHKMKPLSHNSKKCLLNNHSDTHSFHFPHVALVLQTKLTAVFISENITVSHKASSPVFSKYLTIVLPSPPSPSKIHSRKSSYYKSNSLPASTLDMRLLYLVLSLLNANFIHSVATHGNTKQFHLQFNERLQKSYGNLKRPSKRMAKLLSIQKSSKQRIVCLPQINTAFLATLVMLAETVPIVWYLGGSNYPPVCSQTSPQFCVLTKKAYRSCQRHSTSLNTLISTSTLLWCQNTMMTHFKQFLIMDPQTSSQWAAIREMKCA